MGRPRKRQREQEEGNASPKDSFPETGQAGAQLDMATLMSSQSTLPDPAFDLLPGNGLFDLHDGSTNVPQPSSFFADGNDVGSLVQDDQWNPYGIQDGACASSFQAPFDHESMGFACPDKLPCEASSENQPATAIETECSCLPSLYSTLSSFQSLPPPSFPFSMGVLTSATRVAQTACRCRKCPTLYASSLQNLMLLSTLLPLIAHEYGKLLAYIDDRASKGGTITFRMGEKENTPDHVQRHTGGTDCPMAFDMEMSTEEWRSMARKVIKKRVMGPDDISVLGVLNDLESRQRHWHEHPILIEFQHGTNCAEHGPEVGDEHACLQMLTRVKHSIDALKLD